MFYGGAMNIGGQASDPDLLDDGNIQWSALGEDFLVPLGADIATNTPSDAVDPAGGIFGISSGTAVDQQGHGTLYEFWSPGQGGERHQFRHGQRRLSDGRAATGQQRTANPRSSVAAHELREHRRGPGQRP